MDHNLYKTWFYGIILLEVLHVLKINWLMKESKCSTATSSWTVMVVDHANMSCNMLTIHSGNLPTYILQSKCHHKRLIEMLTKV